MLASRSVSDLVQEAVRHIGSSFAMAYVRLWDFERDPSAGPAALYVEPRGNYHGGLRDVIVEAIRSNETATAELAPTIEGDPRFAGSFPGNAYLGVPLTIDGRAIGYVESYRKLPVTFAEAGAVATYAEILARELIGLRTLSNGSPVSRGKILIAEDDPATRMLLRRILLKERYDVVDVANGRAACAEALRDVPDLVLIDWIMPEMDGREATRTLKADPRTAAVPIVMLTSQFEIDEKVLALEAGVQDFLNKPIDPRELVARIEQQLRWRQLLARDRVAIKPDAPLPSASDPLAAIEPGGDLWLRAIQAEQMGNLREAVALNIAEAERCDTAREFARSALAYRNASNLAGKTGNGDLADKCLRLAGKMYLCTGETTSDVKAMKEAYLNASRCFIIAGNVKLAKKAIEIAHSMDTILADDFPSPIG